MNDKDMTLTEQEKDQLVEEVAEAMFNWMVEPWQRLHYKDESLRTTKYRELAKIAVSTIFK